MALEAYLNELIVSWKFEAHGPIVASIKVFVLPPRESCSNLVNVESLYGTCDLEEEVRDEITWQRVERDKLIFVISLNLVPFEPALDTLSDPAKSTMFSFPLYTLTFFS